jgi:glycosyltransferase involved in cell wall biosynthesis
VSDLAQPAVAICIPTFNQADYLPAAVESALAQRYDGQLEVWVGDDASTDVTPAVLARLGDAHPQLRVCRQPRNVGIAVNVTSLLRRPRTELIVRLDSDDELEPGFLAALVPAMVAEGAAGYGHSAVIEIDAAGAAGAERRLARASGFQPAEAALRGALSGYRTVANVLIFRRAALEQLDFYEGRPEFVEDYDLAVRMADAGYGNVYIDESLARYRVWEDDAGTRSRRKPAQLAGYIRIFEEAIEPAWRRRGWSLRPVRRRRRALAAHHCAHCFGPQYSAGERRRLVELLRRLGDGPALRGRLALCRLGLAGSIEGAAQARGRLRARAKVALKRLSAKRS